jgi:hypothetical protein
MAGDRRFKLLKQGLAGDSGFSVSDLVGGDRIKWDAALGKWVRDDFSEVHAGNPGIETGINVNGTQYNAVLKASDMGSSNAALLLLHRHATAHHAKIVASRSTANGDTHSNVVNGSEVFGLHAVGWHTNNYKPVATIHMDVAPSGTVSQTSMPGVIDLLASPEGSVTPQLSARFTGAQAELYHDGSERLRTTTGGIAVTGDASVTEGLFSTRASDQAFIHTRSGIGGLGLGVSGAGSVTLRQLNDDGASDPKLVLVGIRNGETRLYHNGAQKFATSTTGFQSLSGGGGVWGGNGVRSTSRGELFISAAGVDIPSDLHFRSGDTALGSDTNIRWTISDRGVATGEFTIFQGPAFGGGFKVALQALTDGAVVLRHDGTERLRTEFQNSRGGVRLNGATGPLIVSGTGTPEGVVTASVGSIYLRTDSATTLYVKQTGTGNTGWVAK